MKLFSTKRRDKSRAYPRPQHIVFAPTSPCGTGAHLAVRLPFSYSNSQEGITPHHRFSTRISKTWTSQQQPRSFAHLSASTTKEDGITVPVLTQFVIARGEKATADQLTLNQVLITCAATVEAGAEEDRPNLGRVIMASQQAGGAAGPDPYGERNAKRALVQATGDYLWGYTGNGGLRSVGNFVVFMSAMPEPLEDLPSAPDSRQ